MAEGMTRNNEKQISFQKAAKELNITVEKVHYHWHHFINGEEMESHKKGNHSNEMQGIFSGQSQPMLLNKPHLRSEMQAKLVSLRKLALFWDASDLPKKLINLYFNRKFDDFKQVIRIYDVSQIHFNGHNAHHFYELKIPYDQGYWFVKGLLANRSYLAEIGIKLTENEFFPLLRSNTIHTPKMEVNINRGIYHDVLRLHQFEEKKPKWTNHVSTYSYYTMPDNDKTEK